MLRHLIKSTLKPHLQQKQNKRLQPKKWIPTYNIALQSFYFSL